MNKIQMLTQALGGLYQAVSPRGEWLHRQMTYCTLSAKQHPLIACVGIVALALLAGVRFLQHKRDQIQILARMAQAAPHDIQGTRDEEERRNRHTQATAAIVLADIRGRGACQQLKTDISTFVEAWQKAEKHAPGFDLDAWSRECADFLPRLDLYPSELSEERAALARCSSEIAELQNFEAMIDVQGESKGPD